jgi:hypothetical protein
MVKCSKKQIRELKTALRWKIPAAQRERIQMVLLRETGMTQPEIAAAMGVSLSTVNRAQMAYDEGGIKALKPKPNGGRKHENMTLAEEKALLAFCQGGRRRRDVEHPRSQGGPRESDRAPDQRQHDLQPAALPRLAHADAAAVSSQARPRGAECF